MLRHGTGGDPPPPGEASTATMEQTGIVIPFWPDLGPAELREFATAAEELGYHSIWVPEMWGRDALALVASIAHWTDRIGVATGVVSVFSRSPAAIASAAATLDELSGGRMVLGLGTSGPAVIENWHGIPYERPLRRTREYVEIVRLVLSGERVNYEGDLFKLRGFRLMFRPPRKEIPIFIASLGPRNVRLTGEVADGWLPYLIPPVAVEKGRGLLAEGASRGGAGRRGPITVAPYVLACLGGEEALRDHIAHYVGSMGTYYRDALARWGFSDEASRIAAAAREGDRRKAREAVSVDMVRSITLGANAETMRANMDRYRQAGATLPIVMFPLKSTRPMVKETMEFLAPARR